VTVPGTSHATLSEPTREWLSNYIITPGSTGQTETHMSLAGGPYGRLSIPDEVHETWLRIYTQELALNSHSLFFAERRTPVFRMHFDLDFTQEDAVTLHYITTMARECVRVFRLFFPSLDEDAPMWKCVILMATPKPVDESKVKSGCHLLWPWMYVTQVQALQMRANVVDTLNRTWPARTPPMANSYDDVVDRTVLTSNGLRMMGSDKASKCKTCKNTASSREKCTSCMGRGFLVENRAYTLAMVLTPAGEPDKDQLASWKRDLFDCVRFTSIRSSRVDHSAGFVTPTHAITDDAVKTAKKKAKSSQKTTNGGGSVDSPTEAAGLPGSVNMDRTSRIFTEFAEFLTTYMGAQWSGLTLTHLYLQRDQGRYIAHVTGPGSSFCQNVDRAHSSSQIYFEVRRDGVQQRCFSPKVRNGTSCRQYGGPVVSLTRWLHESMFGRECASPPPYDDAAILAKSAEYTRNLKIRMESKKRQREHEQTTLSVLGKQVDVKKGDRGEHQPHPVFKGMTCGQVEKMSSQQLCEEFRKIRNARIAETSRLHAEISCNGKNPIGVAQKKKKIGKAAKRGMRQ